MAPVKKSSDESRKAAAPLNDSIGLNDNWNGHELEAKSAFTNSSMRNEENRKRRCCKALGCPVNSSTHPGEYLMAFPKTDSKRFKIWCEVAQFKNESNSWHHFLCHRHFPRSAFTDDSRKKCLYGVNPSFTTGPLNPLTGDYTPMDVSTALEHLQNDSANIHENDTGSSHKNDTARVRENDTGGVHENVSPGVHKTDSARVHENATTSGCKSNPTGVYKNEASGAHENDFAGVHENVSFCEIIVIKNETASVHESDSVNVCSIKSEDSESCAGGLDDHSYEHNPNEVVVKQEPPFEPDSSAAFEDEKKILWEQFCSALDAVQSMDELEIWEKAVSSILPAIQAARSLKVSGQANALEAIPQLKNSSPENEKETKRNVSPKPHVQERRQRSFESYRIIQGQIPEAKILAAPYPYQRRLQ